MKLAGDKSGSATPSSPAGAPYPITTGPGGDTATIDGKPYTYHAASDSYRYQEPGDPPGDWHVYTFEDGGRYNKWLYPKEGEGRPIHTEIGKVVLP